MANNTAIEQGNALFAKTSESVLNMSPTGTIFTETTVNLQTQFENLIESWGGDQISNVIISPVFTRAGDAVDTINCLALFDVNKPGAIKKQGGGKGDRLSVLTYTGASSGSGGYTILPDAAGKLMPLVSDNGIYTDNNGNKRIIIKKVPDYNGLVCIEMDFFALMSVGLCITSSDDLDFRVMSVSKLGGNNYSLQIAKYIDASNRKKGRTGRSIDYNKVVASMTGRNGGNGGRR